MSPPPRLRPVPPPTRVPAPPADPATLNPLAYLWPPGVSMFRGFSSRQEPLGFSGGDNEHRGRFHPFTPPGADGPLPVLYAADAVGGALSETIFHDVPVRGVKRVPLAKLRHRQLTEFAPTRDLRLVDLTSDGLMRLGLELVESDARSYPDTAAWARALHAHPRRFDGLTWVSRQQDTSRAVVLFSGRVTAADLELSPAGLRLPLSFGAGLDLVYDAANRAGITVTGIG